jgi:hypothetical protein
MDNPAEQWDALIMLYVEAGPLSSVDASVTDEKDRALRAALDTFTASLATCDEKTREHYTKEVQALLKRMDVRNRLEAERLAASQRPPTVLARLAAWWHRPPPPPPPAPPAEPRRPCTLCGQPTAVSDLTTYDGRQLCPTDSGRDLPLSDDDRNYLVSLALSDHRPAPRTSAAGNVVSIGTDEHGHPITLDSATRNKHLYLIGKSRTGKTTLMLNLMRADLTAGDGLTFIDPAGDAAHQLLGYVPSSRAGDVVYFDPTRDDCPALNLLALPYDRDKLAGEIVSAFRLFFDSWGPRMAMLLRNALLALLDDRVKEPHSIADLERLFIDEDYRDTIARRATDPRVKRFLTDDLPRFERGALDPVLNKLDAFLSTKLLARIFGTTTNALDFDQLLNRRGVLVCALAKGKIGEEPAKFLGGLIVAALTVAALARAEQPPTSRLDHFLYVDEFQNFAVESFATIFAEAAKYRLNLTVAHQTRDQLTPEIRAAIGNASTYVVFRVSADDAAALARELRTEREADDMYSDTLRQFAAALPVAARGVLREPDRVHWHTLPLKIANPTLVPEEYRRGIEASDEWRRRRGADRVRENIHQMRLWCYSRDKIQEQRTYGKRPKMTTWPTANDITNLENLHAFARIERPENTTLITVPFPPADDATTEAARAAVLARVHTRAAEERPQQQSQPNASNQLTEETPPHERPPEPRPNASPEPPDAVALLLQKAKEKFGPKFTPRQAQMLEEFITEKKPGAAPKPTTPSPQQAREKNRPHQKPQDARTPTAEGQHSNQNSTTFDVSASDTVHSPEHDPATTTDEKRPPRRLPKPRRRP